jgi:hypothetical protein
LSNVIFLHFHLCCYKVVYKRNRIRTNRFQMFRLLRTIIIGRIISISLVDKYKWSLNMRLATSNVSTINTYYLHWCHWSSAILSSHHFVTQFQISWKWKRSTAWKMRYRSTVSDWRDVRRENYISFTSTQKRNKRNIRRQFGNVSSSS